MDENIDDSVEVHSVPELEASDRGQFISYVLPDSIHIDQVHLEDIEPLTMDTIDEVQDSAIQIQSVHSSESNVESDMDSETGEEVAFDIQLPYQHLYLARNFQALPGHTYLEEDSVHSLPLLSSDILYGVGVLIPGQTIPLNFSHPGIVRAMRESLEKNQNIFGFLTRRWVRSHSHGILSSRDMKGAIGVTLEIFEVGNDQDSRTTDELCCKARVTQRFKFLEISPEQSRRQWRMGRVLILSEVVLPHPLQSARGYNSAVPRQRSAQLTAWPSFVHNQYDVDLVMGTAKEYFLSLLTDKNASLAKIPDDPVQFSFWILINFPVSDAIRVEMLGMNNSLQRLKRLLEYFKTFQHRHYIRCSTCLVQIGHMVDVFSMSASGPQLTYTNPSGFLHETITLYNVTNVHVDSVLSTEYSWFPGYAWKVASCTCCHAHVGWQYVAVRKGLVPKTFYGITKRSISLPGDSGRSHSDTSTRGLIQNILFLSHMVSAEDGEHTEHDILDREHW